MGGDFRLGKASTTEAGILMAYVEVLGEIHDVGNHHRKH